MDRLCVSGTAEPSASPAKDNYRMNRYKNKALNPEEMRRRREEEGIQLRKQKREQQVPRNDQNKDVSNYFTFPQFVQWHSLLFKKLFKRRNVDILNEDEAMFESPLVDSYLSSPVTVSVLYIACTSPKSTCNRTLKSLVWF